MSVLCKNRRVGCVFSFQPPNSSHHLFALVYRLPHSRIVFSLQFPSRANPWMTIFQLTGEHLSNSRSIFPARNNCSFPRTLNQSYAQFFQRPGFIIPTAFLQSLFSATFPYVHGRARRIRLKSSNCTGEMRIKSFIFTNLR